MTKRLGPGDKVKRLRLAMGLKQEDITNEELSKSIVSMIESNKRNLTWHTAQIIAECLNEYYKKVGKEITAEYLMETDEDEVKKVIQKNMDLLQRAITSGNVDEQLIENTFEKVIDMINEWGLEKERVELQILRGNFYYYNYQYKEALKEYLDVLDHCLQAQEHSQVARMYNSIGDVYQMQMFLETAMLYYVKAYDTATTYDAIDKDKRKIFSIFNQILCYRKMKRYDLALSHIKMFKELEWQDKEYKAHYNKVLLLEGNTYRDINNYDRALKLYDRLLNDEGQLDQEVLFLVYDNYAQLYRKQGNGEKALEFIKKASALKDEVDINYIPALYLKEARCYNLLEEYDLVVSLLENGLQLAEKVSKQEYVIEIHFAFVELYLKTKEFETALSHLTKLERIIVEKNSHVHKQDLYSFYCDTYLGLDEKAKVQEYLSKMRKSYLTD